MWGTGFGLLGKQVWGGGSGAPRGHTAVSQMGSRGQRVPKRWALRMGAGPWEDTLGSQKVPRVGGVPRRSPAWQCVVTWGHA